MGQLRILAKANRGSIDMTHEQLQVIRDLRHAGYAICIFSPEELDGASVNIVQGRLAELGNEVIEDLKGE